MPDLESLSKTVEYMRDKLDTVAAAILGDPTDQQQRPGIILRLDRLERSYANHRRALACLGGGVITILAAVVAAVIIRFA